MALFRYVGEYPVGTTSLTCYGRYVFTPGAEIELPEPFASKARGNHFFEEVNGSEPERIGSAVVTGDLVVALPDGITKAELIEIADKYEIQIDKRWSFNKIAETIIQHSKKMATSRGDA